MKKHRRVATLLVLAICFAGVLLLPGRRPTQPKPPRLPGDNYNDRLDGRFFKESGEQPGHQLPPGRQPETRFDGAIDDRPPK
jgi:hypothetical protein